MIRNIALAVVSTMLAVTAQAQESTELVFPSKVDSAERYGVVTFPQTHELMYRSESKKWGSLQFYDKNMKPIGEKVGYPMVPVKWFIKNESRGDHYLSSFYTKRKETGVTVIDLKNHKAKTFISPLRTQYGPLDLDFNKDKMVYVVNDNGKDFTLCRMDLNSGNFTKVQLPFRPNGKKAKQYRVDVAVSDGGRIFVNVAGKDFSRLMEVNDELKVVETTDFMMLDHPLWLIGISAVDVKGETWISAKVTRDWFKLTSAVCLFTVKDAKISKMSYNEYADMQSISETMKESKQKKLEKKQEQAVMEGKSLIVLSPAHLTRPEVKGNDIFTRLYLYNSVTSRGITSKYYQSVTLLRFNTNMEKVWDVSLPLESTWEQPALCVFVNKPTMYVATSYWKSWKFHPLLKALRVNYLTGVATPMEIPVKEDDEDRYRFEKIMYWDDNTAIIYGKKKKSGNKPAQDVYTAYKMK